MADSKSLKLSVLFVMVMALYVYHSNRPGEQWADCNFCNNQGEIEEDIDDDTVQRKTNH